MKLVCKGTQQTVVNIINIELSPISLYNAEHVQQKRCVSLCNL